MDKATANNNLALLRILIFLRKKNAQYELKFNLENQSFFLIKNVTRCNKGFGLLLNHIIPVVVITFIDFFDRTVPSKIVFPFPQNC